MKLALDFHSHTVVKKIIEIELGRLEVPFTFNNSSQLEILSELPTEAYNRLKENLKEYGIQLKETHNEEFIQRIKDIINEIIYNHEYYSYTTSTVISEKLKLSYGYISNLFSEHTLSTLESYIILQRIERAKILILSNEYTLTEIAYKLNYSSVGHLSNQFKKITGRTSTSFVKIVKRRNQLIHSQF